MSKKQPDVTHNQQLAYTAGWLARKSGEKKNSSPFTRNTSLGDLWIQGYKDNRNGTKDDIYFNEKLFGGPIPS